MTDDPSGGASGARRSQTVMREATAVDAMLQAALEVLLDQAGGELSYDHAEYLAIKARRGPYRTEGHVDASDPKHRRVVVRLVPVTNEASAPVM